MAGDSFADLLNSADLRAVCSMRTFMARGVDALDRARVGVRWR